MTTLEKLEELVYVGFKQTENRFKDVEERLPVFKEVFPHYRQITLFGAVAGISTEQEADADVIKNGVFVRTQSGDNIKLLNPEGFQPKAL